MNYFFRQQCLAIFFSAISFFSTALYCRNIKTDDFHDFKFDYEVSAAAKQDRSRMSTSEFLEAHGLRDIAEKLSQFISIFDSSTHFFDQLNDSDEFEILNVLISYFRDSFVDTVDEAKRSAEAKGGSMSLSSMRDFFNRQEMIFNEKMRQDPRFRKWAKVIPQTHHVFDSLVKLYQLCIENGIPMPWWMLQMVGPLCANIPDRLLDHDQFEEFLKVPSTMQASLHELLEQAFTSGFGPMLKIGIQALANWAVARRDEL
jgi:hypothetical protein